MKGRCACGRVTLELPGRPDYINICNCDFCRKRYYFERPELMQLRDLAVGAALAHKDPNDTGNN